MAEEVHYKHLENIAGTYVGLAANEAHMELFKEGANEGTFPAFDSDTQCVYAQVGGQIAALILYWISPVQRLIFIKSGYVWPAYRRQGIYRKLYEMVRSVALQAPGIPYRIQGGVMMKNMENMQAVMKALGREPHAVIFEEQL